jgi:hypothetical protein
VNISKINRPVNLGYQVALIGFSFCFLHPAFCNPYFGSDFFQDHKTSHVFKARLVGGDWLSKSVWVFSVQGSHHR